MVATISPVVHGGRNRNYWSAIALHTLGATASAALLGALLGAAGWLLGAPWGSAGLLVVAVLAAIYAARELFNLPIPLPDMDRQVPDWWRTYFSRNVAAFLYGLGLGVGFLTYLSFGTLVPVAAAAVISSSPVTGALLLGTFGLMRGLSVMIAASSDPETIVEALGAPQLRRRGARFNGVILAGILGLAIALAL